MKKIALIATVALLSSPLFAAEKNSRREINIQSDWTIISCRQMENGGVTIQRRNLPENSVVTVMAPSYDVPVYEVFADGNLLASCRFLTVKKSAF